MTSKKLNYRVNHNTNSFTYEFKQIDNTLQFRIHRVIK